MSNEKKTRLVLDPCFGIKVRTFTPMKQLKRHVSLGWLCGHLYSCYKKILSKNQFFPTKLRHSCDKRGEVLLDLNHKSCLTKIKLCHDIETNPGPIRKDIGKSLTLITLNCRGLGKLNKFRLILKKAWELIQKNQNTIVMLQETMITNEKYLDLAWQGRYAITYGTGNSQGYVTLTSSKVEISNQINFGNRGHSVELRGYLQQPVIVINIYAPNGYAREKKDFFTEIFTHLASLPNSQIIMAGDLNLTFDNSDRHKRSTCNGEAAISEYVLECLSENDLKDTWHGHSGMTWKRGSVMSRLDRIYLKLTNFKCVDVTTDWTFSDPDHAAVIATLVCGHKNKLKGPRICRLDAQVVANWETLNELRQYLLDQLNTLDINAHPHLRLEFAKMTIRTKALELGKKLRDAELTNLALVNDDIRIHEALLQRTSSPEEEAEIVLHLEQLNNEKNNILQKQGEQLAWKARSKWCNEG